MAQPRVTGKDHVGGHIMNGVEQSYSASQVRINDTREVPSHDHLGKLAVGRVRNPRIRGGKVLNVAGASTADGANVDQWDWRNVNQQKFQIIAVP